MVNTRDANDATQPVCSETLGVRDLETELTGRLADR
jgi:hypothetical protein